MSDKGWTLEECAAAIRAGDDPLTVLRYAIAAEKARADAAEAELRYEANRSDLYASEVSRFETALVAARRETALYRGVIDNLLSTMEMQEKRESGEFHITGEVTWGIWSDAKSQARTALAAPAACVTPNGRTDGHGSYVERRSDGSWICTFCKRPMDGAAPAAGEEGP